MRQVALDTETTGLLTEDGHRVIEIGCVEIVDHKITGRDLHFYLNPERESDSEALKIHGLSGDFLKDKPLFRDCVDELLEFIKESELVIHNAEFDIGMLDYELSLLEEPPTSSLRAVCSVLDTVVLARKLHPGRSNSLDGLCRRYDISLAKREEHHGALIDALLLAKVYLAMTSGQKTLVFEMPELRKSAGFDKSLEHLRTDQPRRVIRASSEEQRCHEEILARIEQHSGTPGLWSARSQRDGKRG